jgi:hypothetical protein
MVIHGLQQTINLVVLILVELDDLVRFDLVMSRRDGLACPLDFGVCPRLLLLINILDRFPELERVVGCIVSRQTTLSLYIISIAIAAVAVVGWSGVGIARVDLFDCGTGTGLLLLVRATGMC